MLCCIWNRKEKNKKIYAQQFQFNERNRTTTITTTKRRRKKKSKIITETWNATFACESNVWLYLFRCKMFVLTAYSTENNQSNSIFHSRLQCLQNAIYCSLVVYFIFSLLLCIWNLECVWYVHNSNMEKKALFLLLCSWLWAAKRTMHERFQLLSLSCSILFLFYPIFVLLLLLFFLFFLLVASSAINVYKYAMLRSIGVDCACGKILQSFD